MDNLANMTYMSYFRAICLSLSPMIGNLRFVPEISLISLIHSPCLSIVFALSPMSLTPLFVNSGSSLAKAPSSVVQTGVKSSGWEKRMHHLSPKTLQPVHCLVSKLHLVPMYSWKLTLPFVVSASKLGVTVPRRRGSGRSAILR